MPKVGFVLTKSRGFIIVSVGFMTGILLGSKWQIATGFCYALATAAVGGLLWQPRAPKVIAALLMLLGMGAGLWRINIAQEANSFAAFNNQKIEFEGVIAADVDLRTDKELLTIRPDNSRQMILATMPLGRHYFYGDRVWVRGKLTLAKSSEDFDYARYLEHIGIYATMYRPSVIVLWPHAANRLTETLLRIKAAFVHRTGRILPEVEANLLLGILIGARKALPQEVIDNFSATGTSHIIAISGYNISIIVAALERFAQYLGRRVSSLLSLAVIAAFVIISGASASVLRAAFMGALLLLSFNIGRLYAIIPAMSFAAAVMLLINPKILYWDASFQLSFLATVGLVIFSPIFESLTEKWPNPFQLKSIILTTLAASLATAPIIAHEFGRVSIIGPIANLFVLPLVPLTMLLGFFICLPGLGWGFGWLSHWLLAYMLAATRFFAHLPHASLSVTISSPLTWLCYVFIIALYFILKKITQA